MSNQRCITRWVSINGLSAKVAMEGEVVAVRFPIGQPELKPEMVQAMVSMAKAAVRG